MNENEPKGPWGLPPANGGPKTGNDNSGGSPNGGVRPPDFNAVLARFWDDLNRYLPLKSLGRRGLSLIGVLIALGWLASGVYTVNPQEQGVVLRFGAFVKHMGPGTYWHLPWPIESAYTPNVTENNQVDIGFKPGREKTDPPIDVTDESYMLTGDENIVDMQFTVNWRIKDANAFLFNNLDYGAHAGDTVKAVAESAMREVVGQDRIELIMTSQREEIQLKVMALMQQILDSYEAGIEITGVKMQKADPPAQVRDAYLDVQKALADQDRLRNEAEVYRNKIIPEARGEAAHIIQEAEGYRQQQVALGSGEAQRFNAVYQEYKKAPQVTRQRLYLETMSLIYGRMNKVIVDDAAKGVMPYLQLPPPPPKPEAKPQSQMPQATTGGTP